MLYSEVERRVKAHFRGVDATTARLYIQQALDELCDQFPIAYGQMSLALSYGVGEYALTAGSPFFLYKSATATSSSLPITRIESVNYVTSSYTDVGVTRPSVAPNIHHHGSSGFPAGAYTVHYTLETTLGQTLPSPVTNVSFNSEKSIQVNAITGLDALVTRVNIFINQQFVGSLTPTAGSTAQTTYSAFLTPPLERPFPIETARPTELTEQTISMMDSERSGWESDEPDTPTYYYVIPNSTGSLRLGVFPSPSASTFPVSGLGTPRLDIRYRAKITASYGETDALPESILPYPMAVVYLAVMKTLAQETDTDLYRKAEIMYRYQRGRIQAALKKTTSSPRMRAGIKGIRGR